MMDRTPTGQRLPRPPVAILGVPFDPVTSSEAIQQIEQMIASRRPHYLVTANVDFLVQAQADAELHRILLDAHLVLCDGTPLVWASRWLGNPLPERVAGSDLVPQLMGVAAAKGYRVFLLGAAADIAARAVQNLQRAHPQLAIAGQYSPPFQPLLQMQHDDIRRRIIDSRPDLLLVSFGCPKQEKWMAMHYRSLGVPVLIGIGGTLDFLAGRRKRAPLWMQRTGMEWLFRMGQEPRRLWKRYATDLRVFGWNLVAQRWTLRTAAPDPSAAAADRATTAYAPSGWQLHRAPDHLDYAGSSAARGLFDAILADGRDCALELNRLRAIDSTGVGMLIHLKKQLARRQAGLVLLAPNALARRVLARMRLRTYFAVAADLVTASAWFDARMGTGPAVVTGQA